MSILLTNRLISHMAMWMSLNCDVTGSSPPFIISINETFYILIYSTINNWLEIHKTSFKRDIKNKIPGLWERTRRRYIQINKAKCLAPA